MRKSLVIIAIICAGTLSVNGQTKTPAANGKTAPATKTTTTTSSTSTKTTTTTPSKTVTPPPPPADEDVSFGKSFEQAGTNNEETPMISISPKYYKPGDLAPAQPIALTSAKEEAINLARQKPTQLHKDCLNLIYTVDPIYSGGSISGAVKGTIVIKWDLAKKKWVFDYLKYQLINIDQAACVFSYDSN